MEEDALLALPRSFCHPRPFSHVRDAGRPLLLDSNESRHISERSYTLNLEGIDHVALAVRDVERAARWYMEVLGFEPRHEGMWDGIPVFIGQGSTALALFRARDGALPPASRGERNGMLHLAFRATRRDFIAAQEELKRSSIDFEFQDHEISHSIYFHDPDENELEITTYELENREASPSA